MTPTPNNWFGKNPDPDSDQAIISSWSMLGRGQPRLEILVITAQVQPAPSAHRPISFQVKINWT